MYSQAPYPVRVEWGRRGAREAAERGDIVIVVDVLSFSSTVVTALHAGCEIFPYPPHLDGKAYAEQVGGEYILGRSEAAKFGKATLSPVSFNSSLKGKKFVLTSLNGAFCTWIADKVPALLIGSLLNAEGSAQAANTLRERLKADITVVPCGEQWSDPADHEDTLRPSIEDYLGAGAILSWLDGEKSPEAQVCIGAFQSSKHKLSELIWESGSGRELRARGFEADVIHCGRLNAFATVPLLSENKFIHAHEKFIFLNE
ncbi:2-phosphosulfolactate phosphatase [Neobacillus piezotolerans]|uniref:Probable 2-phosphosulfolactate phosphatase n=2 Tax=Neobacillus piezotolerans TaxID=2259171 RepID=A0A3D8GQS4_9BACI|nr:2-phosphosulfolactate phosphatase [Neobacillus piezotolerans]